MFLGKLKEKLRTRNMDESHPQYYKIPEYIKKRQRREVKKRLTLLENLQDRLDKDEKMLWQVQPSVKRLRRSGLVMVPFGVLIVDVIALFLMQVARFISENGFNFHLIFVFLFILPFAALGLYLTLFPNWKAYVAKRTLYAVTTKRCIILYVGKIVEEHSLFHDKIKDTHITEWRDIKDDIHFEGAFLNNGQFFPRVDHSAFLGIPQATKVKEIIYNAGIHYRRVEDENRLKKNNPQRESDRIRDPRLMEALEKYLKPIEGLLWVGQPDPRKYLANNYPVIIYAAFWAIFLISFAVLIIGLLVKGLWTPYMLIYFAALVPGSYIIYSAYRSYREPFELIYAVTKERCVMLRLSGGIHVYSLHFDNMSGTTCVENHHEMNDLYFMGESTYEHLNRRGVNLSYNPIYRDICFLGVSDVDDLELFIRKNQEDHYKSVQDFLMQ